MEKICTSRHCWTKTETTKLEPVTKSTDKDIQLLSDQSSKKLKNKRKTRFFEWFKIFARPKVTYLLSCGDFELTNEDLISIMEIRGQEGLENFQRKFKNQENLCHLLKTNSSFGLTETLEELQIRKNTFGENSVPSKKPSTFLQLVLRSLRDPTLVILKLAALLSLGLSFYNAENFDTENIQPWIESVAIMVSVIIVVLVTAGNNYSKERQFRNLQSKIHKHNKFSTIRHGDIQEILLEDILVGDILQVKYGDILPADGILIKGSEMQIDESSITGESDLVTKSCDKDIHFFSGTHVMEGSAKIVVIAVGVNSQSGKIMTLIGNSGQKKAKSQKERIKGSEKIGVKKKKKEGKMETDDKNSSVLQKKLTKLTIQLGYFGSVFAIMTFLVLSVTFSVKTYMIKGDTFHVTDISFFIHFFITGVTVLVVAVPEGLPLAVTLALAYSVKKMMNDNNLVRHLYACETMGNATCICSDKTGTLTMNRMTVVRGFITNKMYLSLLAVRRIPTSVAQLLAVSLSVNSNYASKVEPPSKPGELPKQLGNKTECALLSFVTKLGYSYEDIRIQLPEDSFVKVYPFNSLKKYMATVISLEDQTGFRVFVKGAPEVILSRCNEVIVEDGMASHLTSHERSRLIEGVVHHMASDSLRVIAVAYRDILEVENWDDEASSIKNLTLLALLGVEDPLRPEVTNAIKKCQKAGISVKMVTGDNVNTARSIALKCGILRHSDDLILESAQFNNTIRDENGEIQQKLLEVVWPQLTVLARSTPQDKYVLVEGIINSRQGKHREVVAVTGDGTNDAPALQIADVGFAMGISGTDVAKEACDIVITDDNFSSIVKAVVWGRNVYDSISKFLQFQLTVNVVAVIVAFISVCVIGDTPLKAVQMLWVNLIMDSLASLALATELPSSTLLQRKPYGRSTPLISLIMLKNILGQFLYMIGVIFLLLYFSSQLLNIDSGFGKPMATVHYTFVYNSFILMTLFNMINSRKVHGEVNVFRGLLPSNLFIFIWLLILLVQVASVQFGGYVFSTIPLYLDQWLWSIFFGIGSLLWAQFLNVTYFLGRKTFMRPSFVKE